MPTDRDLLVIRWHDARVESEPRVPDQITALGRVTANCDEQPGRDQDRGNWVNARGTVPRDGGEVAVPVALPEQPLAGGGEFGFVVLELRPEHGVNRGPAVQCGSVNVSDFGVRGPNLSPSFAQPGRRRVPRDAQPARTTFGQIRLTPRYAASPDVSFNNGSPSPLTLASLVSRMRADEIMSLVQNWSGPRHSVEAESARRGRDQFVSACAALALGGPADDPGLILALGGPPASWAVTGEPPGPDYWLRTWALRGLLWVWSDGATHAVLAALGDDHWRVREMAAKVVARHLIDSALEQVAALRTDPIARVRIAASRAVTALASAAE